MGVAYDHKQDYDQAITDFNQAIRLKPDYALAYYDRGNAYAEKKAYDQAITDYTQAIQVNKNWRNFNPSCYGLPTAYFNRGLAHRDKGERQSAIQDFQQALKLTQDSKLRQEAEQNLKELGAH